MAMEGMFLSSRMITRFSLTVFYVLTNAVINCRTSVVSCCGNPLDAASLFVQSSGGCLWRPWGIRILHCVQYFWGFLRMNIFFFMSNTRGSSSQLCRVHLCPRTASTSRHRVRSVATVEDKYWRRHRTLLAMSQAFLCWIIHRDSPRLLQQPVAIRHMTMWQRRTSCSVKLPLSYLPWKLRTPRRNNSCTASSWARINLDQQQDADFPRDILTVVSKHNMCCGNTFSKELL